MRPSRILVLLLLAACLVPAGAGAQTAARPANDTRASAVAVPALPAALRGTLVGVTPASDETQAGSVWYRYVAATDGRFVATFKADGDLDAELSAVRQARSQLVLLASDESDGDGAAALSFRVTAGQTVLIRVSLRVGSDPSTFGLLLSAAAPDVRAPGPRLSPRGVTSTLDRVLRPAEAYSYSMREGTTYRINMTPLPVPAVARPAPVLDEDGNPVPVPEPPPCSLRVAMYAAGTTSFGGQALGRFGCDSYRLYTPARGEGGRFVFRIFTPGGSRGPQRYHLQIAPAGPNDSAPGTFLTNQVTLRGALSATGVNRVDLYRFQIKSRSRLKLSLASGASIDLTLRNDRGSVVESSSAIDREIAPGRYFVTVRAGVGEKGAYRIRRSSRVITRASVAISGVARARGRLGKAVTVATRVRPNAGGPVRLTFQRFDPEAGWLFLRSVRVQASGGIARYPFTAPSVGRFRVKAVFIGTSAAAGSQTGFANVLVTSR